MFTNHILDQNLVSILLIEVFLENFDIQKFTGTDLGRAHAIVYETLLDDEENQILGVNHVGDLGGVTPAFVTLFSITEFSYLIRWGEVSNL